MIMIYVITEISQKGRRRRQTLINRENYSSGFLFYYICKGLLRTKGIVIKNNYYICQFCFSVVFISFICFPVRFCKFCVGILFSLTKFFNNPFVVFKICPHLPIRFLIFLSTYFSQFCSFASFLIQPNLLTVNLSTDFCLLALVLCQFCFLFDSLCFCQLCFLFVRPCFCQFCFLFVSS